MIDLLIVLSFIAIVILIGLGLISVILKNFFKSEQPFSYIDVFKLIIKTECLTLVGKVNLIGCIVVLIGTIYLTSYSTLIYLVTIALTGKQEPIPLHYIYVV